MTWISSSPSSKAGTNEIADYSVLVPTPADHAIYQKLVADIHLLPEAVIDPIVLYYRQRDTIEKLVENMRGPEFRDRDAVQQLEMYRDYLLLRQHLKKLAEVSIEAVDCAPSIAGTRASRA